MGIVQGLTLDYNEVRKSVLAATKEKQYQILSQIESFSPEKCSDGNITLIRGFASFVDEHHIEVRKKDGAVEKIYAKDFIVATGSHPRNIPGIEIDQQQIINSDGILNLKNFPKRLLVIGGGIVGCEFATIFSNFQQTDVHILDQAPRILPFEDEDVSEFIANNLQGNGVTIHHNARLKSLDKSNGCLEAIIDFEDGHSTVLEIDVALVSIGRENNIRGIGLEEIGISTNDRGNLSVDDKCVLKSSNDGNIYAVGDISGNAALVSIAEMEGRYAAKAITNRTKYRLKYDGMSTIMFFSPEIAAIGLNEMRCRQRKIPYKVAYYSNRLVNRALAMRSPDGFVKIILSENGKLLGMRAAGPQASACTLSIAMLMDQDKSIVDMMKTVHPHPSITEGIQECLRVLENKSIFKQKAFPEFIKVNTWKPD